MSWRVAGSLLKLRAEIETRHKGSIFWTIGDAAHRNTPSDHNPNPSGVVCAADVKGNAGLNLSKFAEAIRKTKNPALKYVIFNRRIAYRGGNWQPYYGSNPHTDHVHISVGRGSDGQSKAPYDNTDSWKLWSDDVSAKDVWHGYFIDKIDEKSGNSPRMRPESYLAWNHEYAKRTLNGQRELIAQLAALTKAVEALAEGQGASPVAIREAALQGAREALADADITVSWGE